MAATSGYSAREVARLLELSEARIRAYVRAGFLAPRRGRRGEFLFSFQDLVLLRTAKGLMSARIPARRIKRALARLKQELPSGRALSTVQIVAEGDRLVVLDGASRWNPESGQAMFDFEVAELERKVAPLALRAPARVLDGVADLTADDWFGVGADLEASAPAEARDAYRRALELDPKNAEARLNLGRLLHEAGELAAAEANYRMVVEQRPGEAVALFNLGVVLEDRGRLDEAVEAYEAAIAAEPRCSDAYYNLAHVYERLGKGTAALRCLRTYKQLTDPRPRR